MSMNDQSANEVLQCALKYAQMGFSVIPVGKDKKPLTNWKCWQSKKADEQKIKSWFAKTPGANVGIVTGEISGIAVVDVEAGGNIDDLPKTIFSRTGGGGWHFFYKYDPQRPVKNSTRIRHLTDIRGEGGYVVAPPSEHQSGNLYVWDAPLSKESLSDFPYWILDKVSSIECSSSSQSSSVHEVSQINEAVLEGSRNDAATKFAGKIIHGLSPSLWETVGWSGFKQWNLNVCKPPLKEQELRTIWKSITKLHQQKANTKKQSNGGSTDPIEIYAKRCRDGRIVESYYDNQEEETGFLLFEDGKISKVPQFMVDSSTYKAPPAGNRLIASGFVKLPSDAVPFESESSLLQEIRDFIHEFVQIPEEFEKLASFYVLFSWVYDEFQELPYLRAIGDFGSGKSRFLKVMGALCYRSIFLNGAASSSAIFRLINDIKGSIILDEADFNHSDTNSEIVKILNSGFQKGIPVFRSEAKGGNNKSYDPTPFDVYCPKVIATRKNFMDDALESRCLSNAMETLTREDIIENLDEEFEAKALGIRNKLVYFRFQKLKDGISKVGLPKINIEPRLKQIINPIYRVIGDKVAKQIILDFIEKRQNVLFDERFNSFEGELLQAFITLHITEKEPTMKEIAEKYNEEFGGKYKIKPKRAGTVFEQIFHLQRRKTAQGFVVCNNEDNELRLKALKLKFGIDKAEMNIVNDMNITTGSETTFDAIKRIFQ